MEGIGLHIAMLLSWALAGVAGGAAGIGTGMTALPLVLLFLPPEEVVFVTTLGGFGAAIHLICAYRHSFRWDDMRMLFLGCLPGIAVGALTLKFVPVSVLQMLLALCSFPLSSSSSCVAGFGCASLKRPSPGLWLDFSAVLPVRPWPYPVRPLASMSS
jgi:uncharacterized membrane protein YfcA